MPQPIQYFLCRDRYSVSLELFILYIFKSSYLQIFVQQINYKRCKTISTMVCISFLAIATSELLEHKNGSDEAQVTSNFHWRDLFAKLQFYWRITFLQSKIAGMISLDSLDPIRSTKVVTIFVCHFQLKRERNLILSLCWQKLK